MSDTTQVANLEKYISDVKNLLLEVSNLNGLSSDGIDENTSLLEQGLGLDSIDILELVVRLDKRYGVKIKNDENGRQILKNVRCIAEAIQRHSSLDNR
jgi:acyl carrier protein